ncbi:MAG: flagellar hook-length control protein FliK [Gammaproteobacteria bacterium]|nr:flagellar hook-length control protein FliK [Gammaproteobacteria bacterium]
MPSTHLNQTTNPLQLLMASMPKKGSGADQEELNSAEFADLLMPLKADKDELPSNASAATPGRSPDHGHVASGILGKTIPAEPVAVGGGPVPDTGSSTLADADLAAPIDKSQLDDQRYGLKSSAIKPVDNATAHPVARPTATAPSTQAVPGDALPAESKTSSNASPAATAVTGPITRLARHTAVAESRINSSSPEQPAYSRVPAETPVSLPVTSQSAAGIQKSQVTSETLPTTQQPLPSGTSNAVQRQSGEAAISSAPVNNPARNGIRTAPAVQVAGIKAESAAHKSAPKVSPTGPSAPSETSTGAAIKASNGKRVSVDPVMTKEAPSRTNRSAGRAPALAGALSTRRADPDLTNAVGRGVETNLPGVPAAGTGMASATAGVITAATTAVAPQSPAPASVEPVNLEPIDASLGEPEFTDQLFERLSVMLRGPLGQASIRIQPEELGPIRVELNVDGQQASLRFTAAHAETRAALDASMNDLREQFSQEGLELQDAQIEDEQSSSEEQPGADEQRRPGYAAGQTSQGTSTASDSDKGDSSTGSDAGTTVRPPTDGRIDLIA